LAGATSEIYSSSLIEHLVESKALAGIANLGLDGEQTTLDFSTRLASALEHVELQPFSSPFRHFVASKSAGELQALRKAQAVTDAVFESLLPTIRPGITELDLAAEIVYRHLREGAQSMAFEPIVASGPNGALPHARPSDREIRNGDMVVLDFGCFVDGYASDMTRTVAIGTPESSATSAYETVREAQSTAQQAARPGMTAESLDRTARSIIDEAGLGEFFSHSLGHGLGLQVHEWPRIGRSNTDILPENVVITIEPGVYIPGAFGIRIENSVIVTSSGSEALPASDTKLITL
jgi:Xaa-Pro aminopeptidase